MSDIQNLSGISNSNLNKVNYRVSYGSLPGEKKSGDCLDPENTSKCCFFKVANAFLLLFNFLLIVFGFCVLPNKESTISTTDILVSTLSILVTILIGWQIFNAIAARREMAEFKRSFTSAFTDLQGKYIVSQAQLHKSIMDANGMIILLDSSNGNFFPYNYQQYFISSLKAFYYLYQAGLNREIDEANKNFDAIWNCHHCDGVKMDIEILKEISKLLDNIKTVADIELYEKLNNIVKTDIKFAS